VIEAREQTARRLAHDFNNILTAIAGRAQLLHSRLEDPILRQWVEVIERMAWDGARIVRRIQEFARIRGGQEFATVDINELIESREGEGTTFTISLPVRKGVAVERAVEAPPAVPKRATILVIDDEEEVRTILTEILMAQGHSVRMAASGKEGLDLFRDERPDLVLTDLGMPAMSGWQVARAVKEFSRETPVILVTGWGEELDPEAVREGAVDFILSKPFRVHDVLTLVVRALEALP
jgi:CheY-like chemotaxis protein